MTSLSKLLAVKSTTSEPGAAEAKVESNTGRRVEILIFALIFEDDRAEGYG
jgi:hypothetical protein